MGWETSNLGTCARSKFIRGFALSLTDYRLKRSLFNIRIVCAPCGLDDPHAVGIGLMGRGERRRYFPDENQTLPRAWKWKVSTFKTGTHVERTGFFFTENYSFAFRRVHLNFWFLQSSRFFVLCFFPLMKLRYVKMYASLWLLFCLNFTLRNFFLFCFVLLHICINNCNEVMMCSCSSIISYC